MKHATIVDIARKLGLSPSTVSRALNDHPDVREETKRRVRKTARSLSYSPNPIAKSLKSNRTSTIGVIVPEIEHYFFASAISGIEEVASAANYSIVLCQSNESFEREVANTRLLIQHRVAGIIISVSLETTRGLHFRELSARHIPLVCFDRVCDDVRSSKVLIDDYRSAYDAVRYLIDNRRARIAHLGGPQSVGIYAKRRNGYIDALHDAHLPPSEKLMKAGGLYEEHGYQSIASMLREDVIPDAIFAVNDSVAIGAIQRIKESGLTIPGDVAVIGFSNDKITRFVDPPLTTVDQPATEMGRTAARILIDTIEGKLTEPKTVIIPTKLIIRKSA